MNLHWHNDNLLTHIGDDYLQCDIYDFDKRTIKYEEIEEVEYSSKKISLGISTILVFSLFCLILNLFINSLLNKTLDFKNGISFVFICLLFGYYSTEKILHCFRNQRRFIVLHLKDGTQGTFIELENDRLYKQAVRIIDSQLKHYRK